ncbi:MAG TPA: DUF1573 domain-containing protein [Planctomycetota bacterium]|nr:DUF1573 domain-containing protein [Planctomycetota bacterium]
MGGRAFAALGIAVALLGCERDATPASAPAARPASSLVFDEIGKDLGTIVWPGEAHTTFRFRNAGARAVSVRDVGASCGCTLGKMRIVDGDRVVRESVERGDSDVMLRVEPGEKGELLVRIETRGLGAAERDKTSIVTLWTDEKHVDPPRVFLHALIDRAYEVTPALVQFDPMGTKQTATQTAKVIVIDPTLRPPFGSKVASAPPGIEAHVDEIVEGARAILSVAIVAGPGLPKTGLAGDVVIEATLAKPETIRIPFHVAVVPDVSAKPSLFDFQIVEAGREVASVPVVLSLLDPTRKLTIGKPVIEGTESEQLEVRVEPEVEGQRYRLRLVATKGFPHDPKGVHGVVRIPTGLEDVPSVNLMYRAYTREPLAANGAASRPEDRR